MVTKKDFQIKGLKRFLGNDGYVFQVSVYIGGKKAFIASNDGNGAENMYEIINRILYDKAVAYVSKQPPIKFPEITLDYSMDIFVEDLINEHLEKQQIKKWCKKKTVFRLPDDAIGSFRTFNKLYTKEMKKYVLQRYPNAEIMNESLQGE